MKIFLINFSNIIRYSLYFKIDLKSVVILKDKFFSVSYEMIKLHKFKLCFCLFLFNADFKSIFYCPKCEHSNMQRFTRL